MLRDGGPVVFFDTHQAACAGLPGLKARANPLVAGREFPCGRGSTPSRERWSFLLSRCRGVKAGRYEAPGSRRLSYRGWGIVQ
jgi:hypothetical protein